MYNRKACHKSWNHYQVNKLRSHSGHPFKNNWKENFRAALNNPPANVRELDDKYELHLFAPGFEKSDFIIAITDQVLKISVEDKKESQETWKRQEYDYKGFVRQFSLNEKTDKSAISARYENGVLILNLPKLEGFKTSRQEIEIA